MKIQSSSKVYDVIIEKEFTFLEILKQEKNKNKNAKVIEEQSRIKAYSEMTNEEKLIFLEIEKNFLLSQNIPQNNHSYNEKGAYSKKRN